MWRRGVLVIAALYVDPRGVYSSLPGVECWGLPERDAREYAGPYPVVAHPPCERWGRYWHGGPSARVRRIKGDDGGCFASALAAVRAWSGVLEHPEASHAWAHFGLLKPNRDGGWSSAGDGGWTCCVEQGAYGHRARKATWLYAFGVPELPAMRWGKSSATVRLDHGYHSAAERAAAREAGTHRPVPRLTSVECASTPIEFRDVLLAMAATARRRAA